MFFKIAKHRVIRLYQCVFEEMPQSVLQFVFVLKVLQSDNKHKVNFILLVISLIGTLYAVMLRFVWVDKGRSKDNARHCLQGMCCVYGFCFFYFFYFVVSKYITQNRHKFEKEKTHKIH